MCKCRQLERRKAASRANRIIIVPIIIVRLNVASAFRTLWRWTTSSLCSGGDREDWRSEGEDHTTNVSAHPLSCIRLPILHPRKTTQHWGHIFCAQVLCTTVWMLLCEALFYVCPKTLYSHSCLTWQIARLYVCVYGNVLCMCEYVCARSKLDVICVERRSNANRSRAIVLPFLAHKTDQQKQSSVPVA